MLCLLAYAAGGGAMAADAVEPGLAQKLQQRIDALAPHSLTTIDLEAEGLTGTLDATLYVRGGRQVRLVNGTLLTDRGVVITDGSHIELGAYAFVEGSITTGQYYNYEEHDGCPSLVYINGGSLTVGADATIRNTGKDRARGHAADSNPRRSIAIPTFHCGVWLESAGDRFTLSGGSIDGDLWMSYVPSVALVEGGEITGAVIGADRWGDMTTGPQTFRMTAGHVGAIHNDAWWDFPGIIMMEGGTCPDVEAGGVLYVCGQGAIDFLRVHAYDATVKLQGGTCRHISTCSDIYLAGTAEVDKIALYADDAEVRLTSPLNAPLHIGSMKKPGAVLLRGFNRLLDEHDKTLVQAYTPSDMMPYVTDADWLYSLFIFYFECQKPTMLSDNAIVLADTETTVSHPTTAQHPKPATSYDLTGRRTGPHHRGPTVSR